MASISKTFSIGADVASAWDALRDFGNVDTRVAAGFVTNSVNDGDDRVVTFVNGAVARERLVSSDDDRHRLVYSVVESALGLTHYQASVEVTASRDGTGSQFTWQVDLLPDEAAPTVEAMMTAGAAAIARTLAG